MGKYAKYWYTLIGVLIVTFSLLGYYGVEVYRTAPPIPGKVLVQGSDKPLYTEESILDGQTAWQSTGGMQLGSILGHGAYQAPDWTADWLHRELVAWLDLAAEQNHGKPFADLDMGQQAVLRDRLKTEYRTNTFDKVADTMTISPLRAQAVAATAAYYDKLFGAAEVARELCHEGRHPAQRRAPRANGRLLLLDRLGRRHRAPGRRGRQRRHLHQQLAARAADRQPAHGREPDLVHHEHHHHDGRRGLSGVGLVLPAPSSRRCWPPAAKTRTCWPS